MESLNGITKNDKREIANELNNFFINVGQQAISDTEINQISFENYVPIVESSFSFSYITEAEVINTIKELKNKKCDTATIPNQIYKMISELISRPLTFLLNSSINLGIFPDILKTSSVVPIFKKGDPTQPGNYRPISITNTISKIFEKIIHRQMLHYFDTNNLFNDFQFGFTKSRSTAEALICLTEKIYQNLNSKLSSALLLLDFSKAFDSVNHEILLRKMELMGVKDLELKWFKSYLTNRLQFVKLGNLISNTARLKSGVPQGSILGPFLFTIFTNDFYNSHNSFSVSFADDTSVLISDKNEGTLSEKTRTSITSIMKWVKANKLTLNIQKTSYIIFSNRKISNSFEVNINGI